MLGDFEQFIRRYDKNLSPTLKNHLQKINLVREDVFEAIRNVKRDLIHFQYERTGLVPMSDLAQTLDAAHEKSEEIKIAISNIVVNPHYKKQIEHLSERRIDIVLEESAPGAAYSAVDSDAPLLQNAEYRLGIHVGHRSPISLMHGEPSPIDPLLPEIEKNGHLLEVVFYEKDFVLNSPNIQKMYLPRIGASEPVYFTIQAPKRGADEGRIAVYHENHLLQSFLLKANVVSSRETPKPEPLTLELFVVEEDVNQGRWIETVTDKQVITHLEFSRTARFTNLDELERREISMGLNLDGDSSSHTFMFKVDGAAKDFSLPQELLEKQTKIFRDFLKTHIADQNDNSIFDTYQQGKEAASREEFKKAVAELIETGRNLYRRLYVELPETIQAKLDVLAESSDKNIQVTRYSRIYVFPWVTLYDFNLPTKLAGAAVPDICLGFDESEGFSSTDIQLIKKCSHGVNNAGYCIYGLWGIRHQVKQFVANTNEVKDAVNKILVSGQCSVQLAAGTDDTYTKDLITQLEAEFGTSFAHINSSDNLIELLWDDANRPAILIVVGHLETRIINGEPEEPRIVLSPGQKWLLASEILDYRISKKKWLKQPNTLILLMACSSGATEITTLNDFVSALTTAGASAISGTECSVFSSMAARFAGEITRSMWEQKKLGESVKLFYRRLMCEGNPLGFTFNYLGDADLTIQKAN